MLMSGYFLFDFRTSWSKCTTTCGVGYIERSRKCDKPEPKYGGKNCEGPPHEVGHCNENNPCPTQAKVDAAKAT